MRYDFMRKFIFFALFVNYSLFNLSLFCESESSINFANLDEYIELFSSDIKVNKDASLEVQETIVYVNQGKLARGIFRDFPTIYYKYPALEIIREVVGFDFIDARRDGKPEHYYIERVPGGKRVFFGVSYICLDPGKYVYKIKYKTNKSLGFFEKYDELYWNVNGNGWLMPIAKVTAKVILPKGIAKKDIALTCYTGSKGEVGKDYVASFDASGAPIFHSTRNFNKKENLSIVVNWPKGFVVAPSKSDVIYEFIKDNFFMLLSILLIFAFLIMLITLYIKKRKSQVFDAVIPLFCPPEGMSPADVRYIYKAGYDQKVFASEIVNMAVNGLIKIKYEKNKFFGYTYILIKNQENIDKKNTIKHGYMIDLLFKNASWFGKLTPSDSVKFCSRNSDIVSIAVKALREKLKKDFKKRYLLNYEKYLYAVFFVACCIGMSTHVYLTDSLFQAILAFLLLGFFVVFRRLLKGYTPEGLAIRSKIDGFRLFLSTTEEDRLKVIGTPPTKTPELYEKYLPYAMALGVEKQWSNQFARVFAKMERGGAPYLPVWHAGIGGFHEFNANSFSTNLSKSLSKASGKSGGSSGGGKGGGGGGSW